MFPFGFTSINPKAVEPEEKPVTDANQKTPYACLKKKDGQSYCGRDVSESREYMFSDAAYALQHYNSGRGPIHVCLQCAERAAAQGVGAGMKFVAPMALRDIRENNK